MRKQPIARAHQRLPREQAKQEQRQRRSQPEHQHRERDGGEILAPRGQHRRGAQRWPDARTPRRAEQQPDRELTAQAAAREAAQPLLGPIADRPGGEREAGLKSRYHQHRADRDERDCRGDAEHAGIEPDREADSGDEQPDRNE